ncbi:MAG: ArsR/SmtB family transcription factor [Anaerolineae bacterium]
MNTGIIAERIAVDLSRERVKELRSFFKALSDRVRLLIIQELAAAGEMRVSDLAKAIRISQPLVSWHLPRLKKAGLVQVRKEGRLHYCSLDKEKLRYYRSLFAELLGEK